MSNIIFVLINIDDSNKIEITLFNNWNNANEHNLKLFNNEGKIYKRIIRNSK